MSDQYTRVTCGGSPLDKSAPVVGLLFGNTSELDSTLQIMDADDIPTETSEQSLLQVNLHRAVFPQHKVVGWYRVSLDDEPTSEDLQITQHLKVFYNKALAEKAAAKLPAGAVPTAVDVEDAAANEHFIFCLLQVQQPKAPSDGAAQDGGGENTLSSDLPVALYVVSVVDNSPFLLGLNQWQLETSEPERIAVERVMSEQPHHHGSTNTTLATTAVAAASGGSKSTKDAFKFAAQSTSTPTTTTTSTFSPYVSRVQSVQHSLHSLKDRVRLLLSYLQDTQEGRIPPNYSLLRQVQGLLYTLGPLAASAPGSSGSSSMDATSVVDQDVLVLSHLAAVAKTVSAVQAYTDKFRLLHENRGMAQEMRRPF
jgi:Maintenance of mitochondrial structure and function